MANVVHNNKYEVEDYVCPHCQLLFSEEEYLNAHVKTKHSDLKVDKATSIKNEEKIEEYNLDVQLSNSDTPEQRYLTSEGLKDSMGDDELEILKRAFKENPHLKDDRRKKLADVLGRTENQIKSWFTMANIVHTNENETKEYVCEQCHFIFSKEEYLNTHMQTHHSNSELEKDSPKDDPIQKSTIEKSIKEGEVKPSENKNLVCKCGYVAPREDLLKLHRDNVHNCLTKFSIPLTAL